MGKRNEIEKSLKKKGFLDEKEFVQALKPASRLAWKDNARLHRWGPFFDASRLVFQVRRHLGITQEDMAGKCGVSKQYISHLENNYYEGIGLTTLQRILENLGYILEVRVVKKAA